NRSPVLAFSARIWFCGVVTNITPLLTIGGAWCPSSTPVEKLHTGTSFLTLVVLIWSRGLYPQPSYVPRYINQFWGSGFSSRASFTALELAIPWAATIQGSRPMTPATTTVTRFLVDIIHPLLILV